MKHTFKKSMIVTAGMLLAAPTFAANPQINATCSAKKTWSEPIVDIPTDWISSFSQEAQNAIDDITIPDLAIAKAMLAGVKISIQEALTDTTLSETSKKALNDMLDKVNNIINNAGDEILQQAVTLGKNAASALADDLTAKAAGSLAVVNAGGNALGPSLAVTGQYKWCDGDFGNGAWSLLSSTTDVRGNVSTTFNGVGTAQLSTAVGIALGAHASVEAPAKMKGSASVGVTIKGERVEELASVANVYTFKPRYSMAFTVKLGLEAGWGAQLGAGISFTYNAPIADSNESSIALDKQIFTMTEDDPDKVCINP